LLSTTSEFTSTRPSLINAFAGATRRDAGLGEDLLETYALSRLAQLWWLSDRFTMRAEASATSCPARLPSSSSTSGMLGSQRGSSSSGLQAHSLQK
jgi:hypothetical protein